MEDIFAPKFEFAFEVRLRFRPLPKVVNMPTGGDRGMVALDGGEFEGPNISGIALPYSGGDFCLFRTDGVLVGDARYMLQEQDGSVFMLNTRAYIWGRSDEVMQKFERIAHGLSTEEVTPDEVYFRTSTMFEAPVGKHDWLAKHVFVGIGRRTQEGNAIRYYKVL
ncbi:DUF3237 family protein [Altererythrobacter xixiisoli]|uniref:UPF0311 protein GRI97_02250 n=1 Tax=Croceibacterium xixiisoli TaxID=1476466 RepID=A0A6I4TT63_9SPHN|nr:DUF3237 domain-containing protein [Croceibacterium xixiisoli]MXO97808.1 DUF3237 family protein [Croceibacterium xixiisoli]